MCMNWYESISIRLNISRNFLRLFQSLTQAPSKRWRPSTHPTFQPKGNTHTAYGNRVNLIYFLQSPLFQLFHDCVWQMQNQFPMSWSDYYFALAQASNEGGDSIRWKKIHTVTVDRFPSSDAPDPSTKQHMEIPPFVIKFHSTIFFSFLLNLVDLYVEGFEFDEGGLCIMVTFPPWSAQ